jgi:hypothetical protein
MNDTTTPPHRRPEPTAQVAARVDAHRERRRRLGLVRVEVWVPADDVAELREAAAVLTQRHERRLVLGDDA